MNAMTTTETIVQELQEKFGAFIVAVQPTADGIPTIWFSVEGVRDVLRYLKNEADHPYRLLYDLTAIDERTRVRRNGQPESSFTMVYHLLSFDRNSDVRIKVPLQGDFPSVPTITHIWPMANWYEREVWDMFGITFEGHPHLRRLLMPPWWEGHPLRKEHPARATEMGPFRMPEDRMEREQETLRFVPEEWGMARQGPDSDFLF